MDERFPAYSDGKNCELRIAPEGSMVSKQIPAVSEMGQDEWQALEAAVGCLERAWQAGPNPDLAQFLPECAGALRTRILAELVKVDQEHRWENRDHRFLEMYLAQWPELAGSPLLLAELLQAECLTRAVVDGLPARDELAHRFPAIADGVDLDQLAQKILREDLTVRLMPTDLRRSDTLHAGAEDTPVPRSRRGDLPVGSRFGRYEIQSVLGCGGMGTVYQAFDTQLDRIVAIKTPRFDPDAEPELLQRFLHEARAAAGIRHPNVCPVYDVGRLDGVPYLTMAFIEGGSLEDRIRKGPLPLRDAIEFACRIAAGLAAVHDAGIVHRDIKPSNVLIDCAGEPLLADFGLAKPHRVMGENLAAGPCSGTPAYVAPEQLAGGSVDARSDIFSLAVLLHRLVTGQLPKSTTPNHDNTLAATTETVIPPSSSAGMDAELTLICQKALSQDPAVRQASARELANDLRSYLAHCDETGFLRPANRLKAVFASVAGLFMLLCVSFAIWFLLSPSASDPRVLLNSMLTEKWSSPLEHETPSAVSRVQMLPKGNNLLALFNTTSPEGGAACISVVDGSVQWERTLRLQGRVFENGWINQQGDILLTSSVDGYTMWKTDDSMSRILATYQADSGCEYISAIITDRADNVYISGYEGSRSGKGSTCAKLTPDLHLLWENNHQVTEGKDDYSLDMDLDPLGNLYRAGYDNPDIDQSKSRGRVLAHSNDKEGELIFSYAVDEENSCVTGILVDGDGYWYQAYTYDAFDASGRPTGVEHTVVEKRDVMNTLKWRDEIPYMGVSTSRNALSWSQPGSFLLVFQVTISGKSYPGLALYSCEKKRFWEKIVDRPDWNFSRAGAEVVGRMAYLGLNNNADPRQTDVVAVPLDRQ